MDGWTMERQMDRFKFAALISTQGINKNYHTILEGSLLYVIPFCIILREYDLLQCIASDWKIKKISGIVALMYVSLLSSKY